MWARRWRFLKGLRPYYEKHHQVKITDGALEAAAREEILRQQDDAIYKRRNAAIEQERLVKENELNTEIRWRKSRRKSGRKRWR